ncbi:MAG: M48 family metallopeptidase [Pseudolabrys sp.]
MPVSKLPGVSPAAVKAEHRKEQVAQMRDYYTQLARVQKIAFRLRTANASFCKSVTAQIGLHAATVRSLPRKLRSYATQALGLSWTRPTVIAVAATSPAAAAGIMTGDQVLRLDGTPVPPTAMQGWIGRILKRNGTKPLRIALRRDGIDHIATVTPVMGCAVPVRLMSDPAPNAFAGEDKITILSGMLRLLPKDSDLAVIMGHELGHVTMDHLHKRKVNALKGALAYRVEFEREADYVGCYYAARAGYDISGAEEIWRRVSLELSESIRFARTHPTSPERFALMRRTITEIEDKQRRHLPLLPEVKPASAAPVQSAARDASY